MEIKNPLGYDHPVIYPKTKAEFFKQWHQVVNVGHPKIPIFTAIFILFISIVLLTSSTSDDTAKTGFGILFLLLGMIVFAVGSIWFAGWYFFLFTKLRGTGCSISKAIAIKKNIISTLGITNKELRQRKVTAEVHPFNDTTDISHQPAPVKDISPGILLSFDGTPESEPVHTPPPASRNTFMQPAHAMESAQAVHTPPQPSVPQMQSGFTVPVPAFAPAAPVHPPAQPAPVNQPSPVESRAAMSREEELQWLNKIDPTTRRSFFRR